MTTTYTSRYASSPIDAKHYDTDRLRSEYLIEQLFVADTISLTYSHYDRFIVGGAMPINGAVKLETIDALKADYFLFRRELGTINVGGPGVVTVDGTEYEINFKEAIYVGMGNTEVTFASKDAANPAKFYINSTIADIAHPTKIITRETANLLEMGSGDTCNERNIYQFIIRSVVDTCNLQMGMTELKTGSIWNTMPCHQHDRRMEAYFYFEVPQEQAVCHFMGEPQQTRHIWMQNEQAVISPDWSIHSGAGTANYTFIWGMSGENHDYNDMDKYNPDQLK
ncbi:5-dehydro-4-deoxy-D-glucuronate isomerase [Paraferrimonas sp. SM1919]|uniref:5-dehydro-4-deoxy-D-glucuronate isomerase n=1 Tax=Paraferrimonas sp. SM1919 TaxID=2662263 RepID=UPI0013D7EE9B|nr:5-dehydro-4-deoxy-D-glucuronate isomerase [Paraferrimonas sp. SM1919]